MTSYFVFSSLHSAIVPAQGDHAAALSGSCGAGLRPAPLQYLWMGPPTLEQRGRRAAELSGRAGGSVCDFRGSACSDAGLHVLQIDHERRHRSNQLEPLSPRSLHLARALTFSPP